MYNIFTSALLLFFSQCVHSEVYLTKDEALELICETTSSVYDPKQVTDELQTYLKNEHLKTTSKTVNFFKCNNPKSKTTHALIDEELGKHLPMTYIVGIDNQGVITKIELMVFREKYGSGVKAKQFMNQFSGLNTESDYKVGGNIKHVSGATISSKGIAKGAKKATMLWQYFYGIHP